MAKDEGIKYGFFTDRIVVVIAYMMSIFGAWISIRYFQHQDLWAKIAIGDLVGTVIIFIYSRLLKNSSMYDPYWSIAPIVILVYLIVVNGIYEINGRIILVSIAIVYWGVRLTMNWLRTWPGLRHEDWRYIKLANDTGPFYWIVSFLGIHLFPTIMVFLGCLPLLPIIQSNHSLQWTDFLGFFISIGAIEIERQADNQLRAFKKDKEPGASGICETGLWKYSRHPNYFGEIAFWGGIFIIAFGLNTVENLVYGIGFVCMTLLFVFISIPMMEGRQMEKEGYDDYRKRVRMLVPWFPKK
ncbi:MAG: DUF1295 domain-containing protein [Cytophagales bacterium]|nr:DUF1295 domain-containing protein [Cytophagales bacterium]